MVNFHYEIVKNIEKKEKLIIEEKELTKLIKES
jgi:hypothetical protein